MEAEEDFIDPAGVAEAHGVDADGEHVAEKVEITVSVIQTLKDEVVQEVEREEGEMGESVQQLCEAIVRRSKRLQNKATRMDETD